MPIGLNMPIACPACGKVNPDDEPSCQRCRCDLSRLNAIAGAARWHLSAAAAALRELDWARALEHAERSWDLLRSPQSVRLGLLLTATLGQWEDHLAWRGRAESVARAAPAWQAPPAR